MSRTSFSFVTLALVLGFGFSSLLVEARQASNPVATGVISGSVTADQGVVRAFRVKAKDTVHLITYTVFTNKGKYNLYKLPPSTYQVQVMEPGFESPVQDVELRAGESKTVDVALKAKPVAAPTAELVDYDTLYPPGRGRDLLELHAFGFHGPYFQRMPKRSRAGWAAAVSRMFHVPGEWPQRSWTNPSSGASGGYNPADAITAEEKEIIIDYLAANFGPDSKPRDLKLDTLVRDEDALAQAVWVQYEVPPIDPSKPNGSKAKGLSLNRGTHDVAPSPDPRRRGKIWLAGSASSSILAMNTMDLDPNTRTKEWVIDETRANINVGPNAVVERNGHLFWTELKGDSIGDINIATGEMQRYLAPTAAQNMHGIAADSRGNIWYAGLIGTVGRFDVKTKKFTEWVPAKGGNFYQLRIDQRDRVWVASSARRMLVMWDPKTEKWTTYKTPDNIRRIDVDSKGKVWANEYFANAVVMFDPDTEKIAEYKLPLKHGNPYETCVDPDDNIWLENAEYQSFVKFDRRTKKFTYFPYPDLNAHTPDMESDADGTLWSGLSGPGQPKQLSGLKPHGNVPMRNGKVLTGSK